MITCIIATSNDLLNYTLITTITSFESSANTIATKSITGIFETVSKIKQNVNDFQYLIIDDYILGIELEKEIKQIYKINPQIKIVCLLNCKCDRFFGLRLVRSGIYSIICNIEKCTEFVTILKNTIRGKSYFPPNIQDAINKREHILMSAYCSPITKRESDVLTLMIRGKTIQETSTALDLAYGTIGSVRSRIMHKLGAKNCVDAIRIALKRGYVTFPTQTKEELCS